MYTDLVFPKSNEKKLIETAISLGFDEIILCYSVSDPLIKDRAIEVRKLASAIATTFAVYIDNQKDINKAIRITKNIVAKGDPKIFEDKRIKYVINFEIGKRDFIHHRNSGLTQVSIKKAMQTEKTLLVNANNVIGGNQVVLGRMMQNNKFFRKYKPDVIVVSGAATPLEMRAPRDLANLLKL